MKPLRIRVLLTDGERSAEHLWIQHKGDEVYLGTRHHNRHRISYHGSGLVNSHLAGKTHRYQEPSFEDLDRSVLLYSDGWETGKVSLTEGGSKPKPDDLTTHIDVRSYPAGQGQLTLLVGVLPAGRLDLLWIPDGNDLGHLAVFGQRAPWVWAAVTHNPRAGRRSAQGD